MNHIFLFWWPAFFLSIAFLVFFIAPWWSLVWFAAGLAGLGVAWLLSAQGALKTSVSPAGRILHFDRFVEDITHIDSTAYKENLLVGRREELEIARTLLERGEKNSLLAVGAQGCGKSVFLYSVIRDFRSRRAQSLTQSGLSFFVLDLKKVFTEAVGTGPEKEHFLGALFEEVAARGRAFILIENTGEFLGERALYNASRILCQYAEHPRLSFLMSLREEEYRRPAGSDELGRSFETLFLRTPDRGEALHIVDHHFRPLQKKREIFTPEGKLAWMTAVERLADDLPQGAYHEKVIRFGEDLILYWTEFRKNEKEITEETVSAFLRAHYPRAKRNEGRAALGFRNHTAHGASLLPRMTGGVNAAEAFPSIRDL